MDELQFVIDLVQSLGMWAIFAWLYVREKDAHKETRKEYRDDLREIAGIRQTLTNTQRSVTEWKASNDNPN